ncbi:MAG: NAD(P)-dependent oxidoreductase [Streptosporangiaceae bacterium]
MEQAGPEVVVTHWVHPEVVSYLAGFCQPRLPSRHEGAWPGARVAELAAAADGLITCMADMVDAGFLARCPRLRVISATLKGYDNFDVGACTRRGVWLTILPDLLTVPTAELAVALILGLTRQLAPADRYVRSGQFTGWRPQFYGTGLSGAAVGIVGMGQVGQAAATRLRAFGARIRYYDQRPLDAGRASELAATRLDLAGLLATSDVVLAALPLASGTVHLIDAAALDRMRPGAFLVNVGRGSVVDEDAVAAALHRDQLGGYAADVYEMEDWARPGHPAQIPAALLGHPRTLFTPHLGSAVDAARREMSLTAASQVRQALSGQRPDHAVNDPRR